ncbi:Neuromodulin [Saguinus oedipus]|uniref:Neuromodulin n=1 Tax=Saguinus oedipus TaxID=9490 RepID=A0ABQ9U405_SAGOE|nr:Neuromodulin [Saguinus oedipus]
MNKNADMRPYGLSTTSKSNLFQVEKNDEDQKIEQDGIKPEDKAHKAATKIQASFRGHITRKKLKGEKKDDVQAAEADASKKKDEAPVADGVEKKGEGPSTTEAAPATGSKPDETGKAGETPSEEKKGEGDAATEQAAPQAPASSEEKAGSAETESATKASTDNSPSSKAEDAPAKEEPKQADVPAAVTAAAATTPAAEDAAAKATAQPPTETGESSQAEEKIGEQPQGSDEVGGWGGELLFKKPGHLGYQGRGNSLEGVFQKSREAGLNFPK